MRNAFIDELTDLAREDDDLLLLTGDLGFSVFEEFMEELPEQYVNCGVAEQNMMGTAAGLALSGKRVFVYSIIPFAVMRSFEQVRNDVCMHNLGVTIVGVGGGFSYGHLGATHHSLVDIAITRSLPNMTVVVPSDPQETRESTRKLYKLNSPSYLRLGRRGEPDIGNVKNFNIGESRKIKKGPDVTIVTAGPILENVMKAVDMLEEKGISATVISAMSIKPLDDKTIIKSAKRTKVLITVEEHSLIGGLGDAVADKISSLSSSKIVFHKMGVNDRFAKKIGDQEYLRSLNGLSVKSIKNTVEKLIKQKT